ncbi:hypothetical protein AB395_00006352 (plasmid) [Sinorhizobium fredii CCBAU 45436]|nr:hypothetical protein AB395_00006352 [Sinorhizobium fredii CCBAU 45436]
MCRSKKDARLSVTGCASDTATLDIATLAAPAIRSATAEAHRGSDRAS